MKYTLLLYLFISSVFLVESSFVHAMLVISQHEVHYCLIKGFCPGIFHVVVLLNNQCCTYCHLVVYMLDFVEAIERDDQTKCYTYNCRTEEQ